MSLELQAGFEPAPLRLQVGCSTTEATAACCRSFPAVRETSKVCVVLYWRKRNQCVCGASSRFPARRFVHLLDTTSIARFCRKIVSFFSHVSVAPYSSSVNFRSAASFRLYTCAFSRCISSQSRSTCPFRLLM